MRAVLRIGVGFACLSALAASALAADDTWSANSDPNNAFSVETPCSSEEVAAFKDVPADKLPGGQSGPDFRVLCVKNNFMFFAGLIDLQNAPGGSAAFLSGLVKSRAKDKSAPGMSSWMTIDSRRAWINRQQDAVRLAQTGVVEVSATKVIMLTAGSLKNDGLSVADQTRMIDHFYASLKVTAK